MKILVCGSRKWNGWQTLRLWLESIPDLDHIIEGGAQGADLMARQFAIGHKIAYTEIQADWKKYGRAAGPIRNRLMLDLVPDLVMAFHEDYENSKGTKDCVEEAVRRGIKVQIVGLAKEDL